MLDVFTKVVLAGACIFTFAWVILAQRRTIKRLSDAYLRLTHFQRVVVALAVIVCGGDYSWEGDFCCYSLRLC